MATTAEPLRRSAGLSWWPVALAAAMLLVALPSTAWAWTPGTHVFLGDAVLRHLTLLPSPIAALLAAYPADFLYGSIAADTSIAKKYAEVGRHCHSWRAGLEIHDEAEPPALRAFALGYLAHLAADVVAHNFFVPRQLAVTSSTTSIGHSYWESRIDTHLGDPWPRRARELLLLDHGVADAHLDREHQGDKDHPEHQIPQGEPEVDDRKGRQQRDGNLADGNHQGADQADQHHGAAGRQLAAHAGFSPEERQPIAFQEV